MNRMLLCHWLCVVWSLGTFSCTHPDRSNPLESDRAIDEFFIPQIASPVGGEQWFPGTSHEIRWKPAVGTNDSVVTIQLVSGGDTPTIQVIADRVPNMGAFTWEVPNRPSPAYRIRIIGRSGFSENPRPFTIKALPVLERLDIGGTGWEPTALGSLVIFTSDRSGNDDLWMYDRFHREIRPLTFTPGFDGEAVLLKPMGNAIAYTSDRDGQKNIWGMALTGVAALTPLQITTTGGERPAWQNAEFASYLSLVYTERSTSQSFLIALSLNTWPRSNPIFQLPLTFVRPPQRLTFADGGTLALTNIGRPSWGETLRGESERLVYDAGLSDAQLWRVEVTLLPESFAPGVTKALEVFPPMAPRHPSVSFSGTHIAFSANGNLWIVSSNGGSAMQVTFGETEDDYPDWSSETELVFQRRESPAHPWELWTVTVPNF